MDVGAIQKLAETGILGLLLAIALGAIFFLYKENKNLNKEISELHDKRLTDLKESRDMLIEPLNKISGTVELTLAIVKEFKRK